MNKQARESPHLFPNGTLNIPENIVAEIEADIYPFTELHLRASRCVSSNI